MKKVSIIFSFRNEEKNIPELVARTNKVFDKLNNWKYELVFVNDDSTDSSEKILIELQKNYPIKIINMSPNTCFTRIIGCKRQIPMPKLFM